MGSIESSAAGATDALRYWLMCRGLLVPLMLPRRVDDTWLECDVVLLIEVRRSDAASLASDSRRE